MVTVYLKEREDNMENHKMNSPFPTNQLLPMFGVVLWLVLLLVLLLVYSGC